MTRVMALILTKTRQTLYFNLIFHYIIDDTEMKKKPTEKFNINLKKNTDD